MKQVLTVFLCLLSTFAFTQEYLGGSIASANGGAASQYGNTPVNKFTGTPTINVPITSINDGDLSLPISLSYHGSGIKVNQIASSVGLGWNLNAGGSITRYVRGIADERRYFNSSTNLNPNQRHLSNRMGWLHWDESHISDFTDVIFTPHTTQIFSQPWWSAWLGFAVGFIPGVNAEFSYYNQVKNTGGQLNDAGLGITDTEPDLYIYNFGGYTGQFTFDKDKNIVFLQTNDLKIEQVINGNNTSANYIGNIGPEVQNIVNWIITTPDGTKYSFGGSQATEVTYSGVAGQIDVLDNISSTSWNLTKISSFDNKKSISLTYANENYGFQDWTTKNLASLANGGWDGNFSMGTSLFHAVEGKRISQITTKSGEQKVIFTATQVREDLNRFDSRSAKNTQAKALSGIELYYGNARIKEYKLATTYYNGSSPEPNDLRLKLDGITEVSGSLSLPGYSFKYEGSGLPNRLSYSRDYWGYYNGQTSNSTLLPNNVNIQSPDRVGRNGTIIPGIPFSINDPGLANREVNFSFAKKGILNKIVLPTGGTKEFEYESHTEGSALVGGLRIRKIEQRDIGTVYASGPLMSVTNYTYQGGVAFTGVLSPNDYYIGQRLGNAILDMYNAPNLAVFSSSPRPTENSSLGGGHIGYSKVIEDNGGTGQIEYLYKNKQSVQPQEIFPFAPEEADPLVGLVDKINHLDDNGNTISTTEYSYSISNTKYIAASKIVNFTSRRMSSVLSGGGWVVSSRADILPRKYTAQRKYQIKSCRINSTEIVTINDGVETKLTQTFNNNNHSPSKISFISSDGNLHEREYKYIHDLPNTPGYQQLIDQNRISQPLWTILKSNGVEQGGNYTELVYDGGYVRSKKFGELYRGGGYGLESEIRGNFNSKGLPVSFGAIDDYTTSLIYNKYQTKVVASVVNAEANEIAFSSFENTNNTGGWSYNSSNIEDATSVLGTKAYRLNSQIQKYVPNGNYILAFWVKGQGTLRAGNQNIQGSYNWTYHEVPVNNSTLAKIYQTVAYSPPGGGPGGLIPTIDDDDGYTPGGGMGGGMGGGSSYTPPSHASYLFLDEVRLFPADAHMNTITYNDKGLPTGTADLNSVITSFNYDAFLRLTDVKDKNGHVVAANEYYTPTGAKHTIKQYVPQLAYTSSGGFKYKPVNQVQQSETVYDGLGRTLASAVKKVSPSGKDVIQFSAYNAFGKMEKDYMPYTGTFSSSTSTASHISTQQSFYNSLYGTAEAQNPYSQSVYESDLSTRVKKQSLPGKNHKINSGREAEMDYRANSIALDGTIYNFGINGGGTFADNTLRVSKSTDPDGRVTKSYSDNMGRTLVSEIAGLQTYYIYDLRSNVVAVLPPETVAKAKNHSQRYWSESNSVGLKAAFGDEIYWYIYDNRGRLQEKHVPGSDPVSYTYDILDRVKETIDGNGNRNWVEYDILSRVKKSGIYVGSSKVTHSQSFYDNYSNVGTAQIFKYKSGYSSSFFPYVRGMQTGGTTSVLNSNGTVSKTLQSTSYYDEFGRNIYSITDNHAKRPPGIYTQTDNGTIGIDQIWAKYDFTGKLLNSEYIQNAWINNAAISTNIKDRMTYDLVGRPIGAYKSVNGQAEVRVTGLTYDEIGRVKEKALHKAGTSWQWSTEVYEYDLLSRTKSQVNRINNGQSNDLFRLNYFYENNNVNGSYSGNLSRVEWSTNEGLMKHYNYQYDDQYRLISADYGNAFTGMQVPDVFDLKQVTYDDNGNIQTLKRYDEDGYMMDNLLYTYTQDKNQLASVAEGAGGNVNKGFVKKGNGTYIYDDNGNLTRDPFKKVTIAYNHQDKPTRVTNDDGKYVDWVYDAGGNTLSMKTSTESTPRVYVNGFEYYGNNLVSAGFGEGRLKFSGSSVQYEYHITDHLGNTRIAFTKVGSQIQINQENHYYPFGLEMTGSWNTIQGGENNNYKYNGIEKVEQAGLNNYFAFYRTLDPAIGRWWQIDPVAAKYGSMNPYVSMGNNPVNYADPMGDDFNVGNALIGAAVSAGIALLDDGKISGTGEIGLIAGGALISGFFGEEIKNMVIALFDPNSSYHYGDALRAAKHKSVGNAGGVAAAAKKSGILLNIINQIEPIWQDFYKSDLVTYAKKIGRCVTCNTPGEQTILGNLFEEIFSDFMFSTFPHATKMLNFHANKIKWTHTTDKYGAGRNTVPDFISSGGHHGVIVPQGSIYEVKATKGGIYTSSNQGQIRGHFQNMKIKHSDLIGQSLLPGVGFYPTFDLVTTADVKWSPRTNLIAYWGYHISYQHRRAQYKIVNGSYKFRFVHARSGQPYSNPLTNPFTIRP